MMSALADCPPARELPATLDEAAPAPEARRRVLAARSGDRRAMRAIYEAEAPKLLRRLRHLTGDLALAQDLTHDAFVVAFSGRAPYDGSAKLSTWLHGVALNKWRNSRRKTARRRRLLAGKHAPNPARASAASEALVLGELERRLDAALAELPDRLREAFVLRVLEQLPLREAAELAGVAPSTLSKRAAKAEARVRAAIEADELTKESR